MDDRGPDEQGLVCLPCRVVLMDRRGVALLPSGKRTATNSGGHERDRQQPESEDHVSTTGDTSPSPPPRLEDAEFHLDSAYAWSVPTSLKPPGDDRCHIPSELERSSFAADEEGMDQAGFPWRQLGTLLVDEGVLSQSQLEFALTEQRRTGRLLGQILVDFGYLSGFSLARALAAQHGVELRPTKETPAGFTRDERGEARDEESAKESKVRWRPLGKLLVENGFVSRAELEVAIMEQRRSGGRLGEILVQRGCLSGPELARALAAQHGVDLTNQTGADDDFETVMRSRWPTVFRDCACAWASRRISRRCRRMRFAGR